LPRVTAATTFEVIMGQPLKDPRAEREAYYRRIAPAHLTPLWEMMSALVPRHPILRACRHYGNTPRCDRG